jgi:DnaJ family protein C protein 28
VEDKENMLEIRPTMEYKDWRKSPDKHPADSEQEPPKVRRYYGKRFEDYISEQIHEAEARGEFDNLQGAGKPLNLDSNVYAGDKAMGYSLLKSQGYAPKEIELAREIRTEYERAEAKTARLCERGRALRSRRVSPFASEKRAFNASVERAAAEYDKTLRGLNSKILTLNLMTPPVMHQRPFDVEKLVQGFRRSCPLFD